MAEEKKEDEKVKVLTLCVLGGVVCWIIGMFAMCYFGTDVIQTEVLDEVCHQLYGDDTEYVSTYFGAENQLNCKYIREEIKEEDKPLIGLLD